MFAHAPWKALLMRKTAGMRRRNETNGDLREKSLGKQYSFFLFALYNLDESVEKSKYGCSVCRKKSQLSLFQKAKAYTDDFDSCFGIRTAIDDDELICERYRSAV